MECRCTSAAEARFLICALYATLRRRSFTVSPGAARSSGKIKIKVPGSGQECPLHTGRVDAARVGFGALLIARRVGYGENSLRRLVANKSAGILRLRMRIAS